MINLLPPDVKQEYRYARLNAQLLKWCVSFVLGIAGVAIITLSGIFIMNNSSDTYKMRIADAKSQLASQDIAGTQKQVGDISSNLKLMVTVLSKEVLFSKLLTRLGNVTPSNVVLTGLTISQTESAVDITAQTGNYEAATQLQANLADSANQIFAKADIVSINCSSQSPDPNYPCTATIRALFTKDNPFLFIGDTTKKAGA